MIIVGFINNSLYYTTFNLLSILFEDFKDEKIVNQRDNISAFCLIFNFLANIIYLFYFQSTKQRNKLVFTVIINLFGGFFILFGIKRIYHIYYIIGASLIGFGQTLGVICLSYYYKIMPKDIAISMNHGYTISGVAISILIRVFLKTKE
jgi:hypothetical protein